MHAPGMVRSQCPYCGVGCQMFLEQGGKGEPQPVRGEPNRGSLCVKGATLLKLFRSYEGRATVPLLRQERSAPFAPVSWEEALLFAASRIAALCERYGRDAFAFYGSGQLDTESIYLLVKLVKGYLRSNHLDTNSRLCMASAATAYRMAFGSDGPPGCYEDLEEGELFLVMGANMAENHPVLWERIRRRSEQDPRVRLVVCDPRRSETARQGHIHLPVAPGGDIPLLLYLCRELATAGCYDQDYLGRSTENPQEFLSWLRTLPREELVRRSGVTQEKLDIVVQLLKGTRRIVSLYCQGLNQSHHGVENNLAILNLHLLLGAVGKPGATPFSLTGQPNAMGGREAGYLSHQLPGYRFVYDREHRTEVERAWHLPPGSLSSEPGYSATEIFAGLEEGRIRGVWIVGTNPVVSMPEAEQVREGLARAELVIVQDAYHPTETSRYAHLILPAAAWGEKMGTMTNSERRVMRSFPFLAPPGDALPDRLIFQRFASTMGFPGFDFPGVEEVWDEYRLLTRGRVCEQTGITNERLRKESLRWPCPDKDHPGTARLYTEGIFPAPSGRARFHLLPSVVETTTPPDPDYPFVLTTGRVKVHWHTRTRTGKIPELNEEAPHPFLLVHPRDARALGCDTGERVRIWSRQGSAVVRILVSEEVPEGLVFMPFHWGDLYHREANANNLTAPILDPYSLQPQLKCTRVRLTKEDVYGNH